MGKGRERGVEWKRGEREWGGRERGRVRRGTEVW